ncbi:hypothetical protein [Paracnuella aquatica]|uniref:hypothetical protein n=1 Tax=Paracnuella aquatica TaxID=2268757 RepID=UPI000F4F9DDE|nr:hypothetical protein [Paracnuella aquatica]RPD43547.1 hypothetical protein DRJ53_19600 [Paracnuella aquatica]
MKKKLSKAREAEGSKEAPSKTIEIVEYIAAPVALELPFSADNATHFYPEEKPNHYAFQHSASCLRPPAA